MLWLTGDNQTQMFGSGKKVIMKIANDGMENYTEFINDLIVLIRS
jgi:hypothetical protein